MLFTIEGVLGVTLFCVIGAYFLNATRVREFAIAAVTFEGKKGNFQLLDQSVHLIKLSLNDMTINSIQSIPFKKLTCMHQD